MYLLGHSCYPSIQKKKATLTQLFEIAHANSSLRITFVMLNVDITTRRNFLMRVDAFKCPTVLPTTFWYLMNSFCKAKLIWLKKCANLGQIFYPSASFSLFIKSQFSADWWREDLLLTNYTLLYCTLVISSNQKWCIFSLLSKKG